jgi:Gluconate 2-dehydrogenase subunit 3
MRRRDFVKGIVAASAAARTLGAQQVSQAASPRALPPPGPTAPGPVPWMRGLMEVKPLQLSTLVPDAVAQTDVHFFNPRQTATLRRLCALLMPPLNGYPGALETATPEFLDFLVSVSPQDQKQMYLEGLEWLDAESHRMFFMDFAMTSDIQADALIRPWLRAWMNDHPPTEPKARFVNLVHNAIRTATVNSQAWSDAAQAEGDTETGVDLYWYPVDPDVHRQIDAPPRQIDRRPSRG